jgi:hypothetical protein
MAHLPLRKPKYGATPRLCACCRVMTGSADLVYDPRKPKNTKVMVCRWCGGWLAGYRPAWSGHRGGRVRYLQETFASLSTEATGGTDSPADHQKRKR